jgi:outer membrane protein assembly factor BamB
LDANTGKLKWTGQVGNGSKKPKVSEETGYAAPTAATDGAGVYAIFATGDIAGFDMSGKKLWEKDLGLPDNPYGHSSSLLVYDGKVIVQYDQRTSQKILALSVKTGATVWSTNRTVRASWSSPILVNTGNRSEIITVAEPYVAAYNPSTGKEIWKIESIGGEVGPSAAYSNGLVFAVNDYSTLCAIKAGSEPAILWENNELLSDIPSPVANEKYLFLATSYGVLVCYDAVTGEKYWEKDFGNSIYSSPVIAENKLYVMDATGVMHIVATDKEYRLVGESSLGEHSATTPAFTNGRIYIRGVDHIYCFGK